MAIFCNTKIYNKLTAVVHSKIRLGLFDFSKATKLHVDTDNKAGSAILIWGDGEIY